MGCLLSKVVVSTHKHTRQSSSSAAHLQIRERVLQVEDHAALAKLLDEHGGALRGLALCGT